MKTKWNLLVVFVMLMTLVGGRVTTVQAAGDAAVGGYQVGFQLWQGAGFEGWAKTAITTQPDGTLTLDYASATTGSDPACGHHNHFLRAGCENRVHRIVLLRVDEETDLPVGCRRIHARKAPAGSTPVSNH